MTLTVEQLINALDAKSIHYRLVKQAIKYHTITFDCPFSKRHEVLFDIEGEFMTQSTATFNSRDKKDSSSFSHGEKYKTKLLAFLIN